MLVAAPIQQSEVGRESEQEAQFLNPQVCAAQVLGALPRVGRLDQGFELSLGSTPARTSEDLPEPEDP
jgi:hypothetical protein